MKTSIATVSINGTLKEKIFAIAKAGFDGVEILDGLCCWDENINRSTQYDRFQQFHFGILILTPT